MIQIIYMGIAVQPLQNRTKEMKYYRKRMYKRKTGIKYVQRIEQRKAIPVLSVYSEFDNGSNISRKDYL